MKLLFLVTEDWYFCSHRLPLALAATEAGHEVVVVTRVQNHGDVIRNAGLALISFENNRGGTNPFKELGTLIRLIKIYRRHRPDIVHHVAMKPVLYGSIATRIAGVPRVVNALTGLGWLFSSTSRSARVLQPLIRIAFAKLLKPSAVIVQNAVDASWVESLGAENVHLVAGSGVDTAVFAPSPAPQGMPVVVLVARLLTDKGVYEFADAASALVARGVAARFVLVGAPDPDNPSSIPQEKIDSWAREARVEWWGRREDMPQVLAQAHIACLPSYREGLPKSLLEAASCGLPIVTTDVPGCRDVVQHEHNGLLVPARDAAALADALERLINDATLRKQMGERGRSRVLERFTQERIIAATLEVYRAFDPAPEAGKSFLQGDR